MAKVYIETSFFSAAVSVRRDARSAGWRASSVEWWQSQAGRHELFIAAEVVRELTHPEFRNREKATKMLRGLGLLPQNEEVAALADLLVKEKVMPAPALAGDALHVAVATVHRMDYILTWNVKHLANPNKRTHFGVICMRVGLLAPQLVTPDLLQENEDEDLDTPIE